MRAGAYIHVVLLLNLLIIQATRHQGSRQLLDFRKLQWNYWLKAAAKQLGASETANTPACSSDYGQQYLLRWNKLMGTYCNSSAADTGSGSTITCHAHPEADISTCLLQNMVLQSSSAFLGSKDGIPGLPNPAAGSIRVSCNRTGDPKAFLRGRLHSNEGSRVWLVQAPAFGVHAAEQQRFCSPDTVVTHPVLFLMRVDPENAFHNLEMVVSVFAALAALQLPQQLFWPLGLEVVIADDRLPGYFSDVWRRLSHPYPLRFLRHQPYPDGTCFATALLAPYTAHAQSLLTYKAGTADDVQCESLVLYAASMWLRHLFRDLLPASTHSSTDGTSRANQHKGSSSSHSTGSSDGSESQAAATSSSSSSWRHSWYSFGPAAFADLAPLQPSAMQAPLQLQRLHVVWLSRSRFERQHEQQLTSWQRARVLPAQQQERLLAELQLAVVRWNDQTCVYGQGQHSNCTFRTVSFSLQVAELSELPFYPDQISLLMRTGVLMGVHGAGLANQVFMQPRSGAVVEVWHNMEDNFHYHNLAHMLGHKYFNVRCEGELDVHQTVQQAVAAMDAVAAAHTTAAVRARVSWWRKAWPG